MIIPTIPELNQTSAAAAQDRQNQLTKPTGAMGILEELSVRLAGMTGQVRPRFHKKGVICMAADHGIAMEGVSAYPVEVTGQMVMNILEGGAAVSVLARQAQAEVVMVDMAVAVDLHAHPALINRKIAYGSANMLKGPAMTREQAVRAVETGIALVLEKIDQGWDLVATGDMGIGNTTPSSAITAVITGMPVEQVTGRGTGLDDAGLHHKVEIIEQVIAFNHPNPADAFDVLSKVGGYEIAGLAGVILGAASRRVPVVVDGFISGAAALIAAGISPASTNYMIASHQSVEIGHRGIWSKLGLRPLLNLDLRLGEGTGAVLAFHLIEAATRILDEMATFGEAGVSDK